VVLGDDEVRQTSNEQDVSTETRKNEIGNGIQQGLEKYVPACARKTHKLR
jgi:hypothetical protein